jgi:hypothetical protein
MPLGQYRNSHSAGSHQKQVTADDQGNLPQLQIRGTEVVLGDGAVASVTGGVAIGTNAAATTTANEALAVNVNAGQVQTANTTPGAVQGSLAIKLNGTVYFIPLHAVFS